MDPADVEAILRAYAAPVALQYEKDCYALSLLAHVIGGGRPIAMLRRGPFGRLLEKAIVRRALARASGGVLKPEHLGHALPGERECFPITLSSWGGRKARDRSRYYQTSRPGQNLVVQLNFPERHDRAYRALVKPKGCHPFAPIYHPVRMEEPFTLAWARLDLDVDSGEVLIEEVQSDWVRYARTYAEGAVEWLSEGNPPHLPIGSDLRATAAEMLTYVRKVLAPYARVWEEAVLTAAIELAYERFGSRRVYFHTYEGGLVMKRLDRDFGPPRSLYTDLPERFGFSRTDVAPRVFRRDRRVREGRVEWFVVELV